MADAPQPRVTGLGIATLDYLFLSPPVSSAGRRRLRDYAMEGAGWWPRRWWRRRGRGRRRRCGRGSARTRRERRCGWAWREKGWTPVACRRSRGKRRRWPSSTWRRARGRRTIYCSLRTQVAGGGTSGGDRGGSWTARRCWWTRSGPRRARNWRGRQRRRAFPWSATSVPRAGCWSWRISHGAHRPRGGAERLAPRASWADRLRLLADTGAAFVAITAGGEGCYYLGTRRVQPARLLRPHRGHHGGRRRVPRRLRLRPGAALAGRRAAEFSAAVAALSCRGLGGRRAIPRYGETCSFLRANGSGRWEW